MNPTTTTCAFNLNSPHNEKTKTNRNKIKLELQKISYSTLKATKSPKEFVLNMRKQGVKVENVKNKKGETYGIRFSYQGETFKASEIGREFGLYSFFNHYGQIPTSQKGNAYIPKYENSNSVQKIHFTENNNQHSQGGIAGSVAGGFVLLGSVMDTSSNNYDPLEQEFQNAEKKKAMLRKRKGRRM